MFIPPYNPRNFQRANRYLARGRLRSMKEVLVNGRRLQMHVTSTNRRPLGFKGRWIPFYTNHLYRNGYQKRRIAELLKQLRLGIPVQSGKPENS